MKINFLNLFCFLLLNVNFLNGSLDFGYHNYESLTNILKGYAKNFPDKTHLYSIGKSVQGRNLWVLAIANSKPSEHVPLRPEAKYIGNMHGNEVPSKENLLHLIDYLLNNQKSDPSVDYLLKNTRIHIFPSMNPDGFENSTVGDCYGVQGRYNAKGFDLNRNFPDFFNCNPDPIQPEVQAVINWLRSNTFVLSANFHEGAIVANYPFDDYLGSNEDSSPKYSKTDDDDIFRKISSNYSFNHPLMPKPPTCDTDNFTHGITNGAAWYTANGGMQDFNYWGSGSLEITIEVGCCKYPQPSQLSDIWQQNKKSLVEYLKLANTGVRGIIKYANGQPAVNISVRIDRREPIFKTNKIGEYYRILLPGTYTLSLLLNCDQVYKRSITIPQNPGLLEYNITLPKNVYLKSKKSVLSHIPIFCRTKTRDCNKNY